MKRLATPLLGALAVVAATSSDPFEDKKDLTEQLFQQYLPAFIKEAQELTYLPQKEGLTLKSHSFKKSSQAHAGERELSFAVDFEDQDKTTYSGTLNLHYNEKENTSHLSAPIINSWDNSKVSNKDLPLSVSFDRMGCYKEEKKNIVHEITESGILKTMINSRQVANIIKNLSQILTDVKVSHASITSLNFDCLKKTIIDQKLYSYILGKVEVSITGNHKGKEYTYKVDFDVTKNDDGIFVRKEEVSYPKDEDICKLLEDISIPKAVKTLQEKNIIPVETYTIKKNKCEYFDNWQRRYPTDETHYVCDIEIVNPQNVSYVFQADAGLSRVTGYFNSYGEVDSLKWNTTAAKVENNPLFPTEYFYPKFDCKSALLADQKAIAFNQEIPVKLFNFIINKEPLKAPKEIVGKKFTVSESSIKVKTIESFCSWGEGWNINEQFKYELTGVLTTSDGAKWKVDLKGSLLSEPLKDEGLLRKVVGHFQSKKDPLYNRLAGFIDKVTLMK